MTEGDVVLTPLPQTHRRSNSESMCASVVNIVFTLVANRASSICERTSDSRQKMQFAYPV